MASVLYWLFVLVAPFLRARARETRTVFSLELNGVILHWARLINSNPVEQR